MKWFLILLMVLFTLVSGQGNKANSPIFTSQNRRVDANKLCTRGEDVCYFWNEKKPFTGRADLHGPVPVKSYYKDGKLHGESITFYPNGRILKKISYKNGKLHGERILYYEHGQVKDKVNFINGLSQGEWIEYYENEQVKSKSNIKDGKLHGEVIKYYEDGQIEIKENYIDGVKQ